TSGCDDHGDLSTNQFGRQRRQPIVLALRPAVFDHDVLALDIAGVFETLARNWSASIVSGDLGSRNPITGIAGCCARAASGHAAPAPRMTVTIGRRKLLAALEMRQPQLLLDPTRAGWLTHN